MSSSRFLQFSQNVGNAGDDDDGRKMIVMWMKSSQKRRSRRKKLPFYFVNFPLDLLKSQLEVKYVFEHDALDVFN